LKTMKGAADLARQASSRDPAVGLEAVWALRSVIAQLEELQVDLARDQGWTWQQIADALRVSVQAVHQKHARRRAGKGMD
jgi:hypothetical protein